MTVVPVKEAKDTSFKEAIFNDCIEALENDSIPQVTVCLKYISCIFWIAKFLFKVSHWRGAY